MTIASLVPSLARLTLSSHAVRGSGQDEDVDGVVHKLVDVIDPPIPPVEFRLIESNNATLEEKTDIITFLENVTIETGAACGPDAYLPRSARTEFESDSPYFVSLATTRAGEIIGACILSEFIRKRANVNYLESTRRASSSNSTLPPKRPRGMPVYKVVIIAVRKEYRRHKISDAGVGTLLWQMLLQRIEEECNHGPCQVQVQGPVCLNQDSSRRFWEKNGFKLISTAGDEEITATRTINNN